ATAMTHLGKLEIARARQLLEKIDAEAPPSVDVRVALYRCARYSNNVDELHKAARHALSLPQTPLTNAQKLKELFDDYRKASGDRIRLEPGLLLNLARAWTRIGAETDARTLLRALATRHSTLAGLPEACFDLARRSKEASPEWREQLQFVIERFPASPVA